MPIITAREIASLRDTKAFEEARERARGTVDAILATDTAAKRHFRAPSGSNGKEEEFRVFGNTLRRAIRLLRLTGKRSG